jgi:phosphoglycerate kinase
VGFLNERDLVGKFHFVSTGGGAMLEFLSGDSLPGISALQS